MENSASSQSVTILDSAGVAIGIYEDVGGKIECTLCGEADPQDGHASTAHGLHQCNVCLHVMRSRTDLASHMWRHGGDNPKAFTCELCGAMYNSKQAFAHHKRKHVNPMCLKCGTCGCTFDRPQGLARHINVNHLQMTVCRCDICDLDFTTHSAYVAHKAFHDTRRPFPCPLCPCRMKTAESVQTHIKHVHLKKARKALRPPPKSATCPYCGLTYQRGAGLLKHIRRFHSGADPCGSITYLTAPLV
jgi:uncharacterized C2H2 Zn-finger protein